MRPGVGVLLLFVRSILTYEQSDYKVKIERIEVVSYDKSNVKFAKTHNFKYNRTTTLTNFTLNFNRDLGNDLKITIQAYKFSSNEYREFPMGFGINFCAALSRNDFGMQNIYRCGNFTRCPLIKGDYVICNWKPDYSKFPPYIPGGRYMLDLKFLSNSAEITNLQAYGEIVPKMKWE